jgi:hypothetical protein
LKYISLKKSLKKLLVDSPFLFMVIFMLESLNYQRLSSKIDELS